MVAQISVSNSKLYGSILQRFYTKQFKDCYHKWGPVSEFRRVRLLHDDAPSQTSKLVEQILREGCRLVATTILSLLSPMVLLTFLVTCMMTCPNKPVSAISQCLSGPPWSEDSYPFQKETYVVKPRRIYPNWRSFLQYLSRMLLGSHTIHMTFSHLSPLCSSRRRMKKDRRTLTSVAN